MDTPDTDNVDFSKPYILSVTELKDSSEENGENNSASQQENESEKLGGKRLKISGSASKTKNWAKAIVAEDKDENNMTAVSRCCKLIGKLVEHFCYLGEEDKPTWLRSVVLICLE